MTNQEIKTVGQTIAQETQIGGNTAARVGGVIEGIGVALDNKDAANGYYQATINGGTITVNAPNYLLGSGGNLRIKMPSAGTTASTLTIGNANAVQLWYNGAAVSAQNTWEAEEIISVFYDGTRFMASNAQGGGGKAEKIKYNNSQSGLASNNVQGALDEVNQNTISKILLKEEEVDGYPRTDGSFVSLEPIPVEQGKVEIEVSGHISKYTSLLDSQTYFSIRLLGSDGTTIVDTLYSAATSGSDTATDNIAVLTYKKIVADISVDGYIVVLYRTLTDDYFSYTVKAIENMENIGYKAVTAYDVSADNYTAIHDVQQVTERVEDPVYEAWGSSTRKRRYISYNCATHGRITFSFTDNRFVTQVIVSNVNNNINSSIVIMPGDDRYEYANKEYSLEWDDDRVNYVVIYVKLATEAKMTDANITDFKESMTLKIEDLAGYDGIDKKIEDMTSSVSVCESYIMEQNERKKDLDYSYNGAKIVAPQRNTFSCLQIGLNVFISRVNSTYDSAQAQAVYKNHVFRFHDNGYCTVYDISNINAVKYINGFALTTENPGGSTHCNAAEFAPTVEDGYEFPLCYVTSTKTVSGIDVLRITRNVDNDVETFSASVIQGISFDESISSPLGNLVIGDDGYIWSSRSSSDGTFHVRKIACPDPLSGNVVLDESSILEYWTTPIDIINTFQASKVYNQKIYFVCGKAEGASGTPSQRCFYVIDIVNRRVETFVNLDNIFTQEPEDIDVWGDKFIIGCNAACSYLLDFR